MTRQVQMPQSSLSRTSPHPRSRTTQNLTNQNICATIVTSHPVPGLHCPAAARVARHAACNPCPPAQRTRARPLCGSLPTPYPSTPLAQHGPVPRGNPPDAPTCLFPKTSTGARLPLGGPLPLRREIRAVCTIRVHPRPQFCTKRGLHFPQNKYRCTPAPQPLVREIRVIRVRPPTTNPTCTPHHLC
mgnify:CR=1 FL=1